MKPSKDQQKEKDMDLLFRKYEVDMRKIREQEERLGKLGQDEQRREE